MTFAVTGATTSPAILAGESELMTPDAIEATGIDTYHPPVEAARSHRTPSKRGRSLKGLNILHVDDQPIILATVKPILQELGLNVTSMTDPREALRLLKSGEKFDLLILDFIMPELDGVTLYNELLKSGVAIPTLFLSGSQGNRQTHILMSDLDEEFLRNDLPIAIQKKEAEGLVEALEKKLKRLASVSAKMNSNRLQQKFPQLRSAFDEGEISSDMSVSKNFYRQLCEAVCDTRFALHWELLKLNEKLAQVAATLEEGSKERRRIEMFIEDQNYFVGANITLETMLAFNYPDWHLFKNKFSTLNLCLMLLDQIASLKAFSEDIEKIRKLVGKVQEIAKAISFLFYMEKKVELAVLSAVQKLLDQSEHRTIQRDLNLPPDLSLQLPSGFIEEVLSNLIFNAHQATPIGGTAPIVRAEIIVEGGKKYLYLGIRNATDQRLSDVVRARMLSDESFSTKSGGSGIGLALIKEYVKKVSGSLRVVAEDNFTEVGVLIPIKKT